MGTEPAGNQREAIEAQECAELIYEGLWQQNQSLKNQLMEFKLRLYALNMKNFELVPSSGKSSVEDTCPTSLSNNHELECRVNLVRQYCNELKRINQILLAQINLGVISHFQPPDTELQDLMAQDEAFKLQQEIPVRALEEDKAILISHSPSCNPGVSTVVQTVQSAEGSNKDLNSENEELKLHVEKMEAQEHQSQGLMQANETLVAEVTGFQTRPMDSNTTGDSAVNEKHVTGTEIDIQNRQMTETRAHEHYSQEVNVAAATLLDEIASCRTSLTEAIEEATSAENNKQNRMLQVEKLKRQLTAVEAHKHHWEKLDDTSSDSCITRLAHTTQAATTAEDAEKDMISQITNMKNQLASMEDQKQHCEMLQQANKNHLAELSGFKIKEAEAIQAKTLAEMKHNAVVSELEALKLQLAEMQDLKSHCKKLEGELKDKVAGYQTSLSEVSKAMQTTEDTSQELKSQLEELREQFDCLRAQNLSLSSCLETAQNERTQAQKALEDLQKESSTRLNVELEKAKHELEQLTNQVAGLQTEKSMLSCFLAKAENQKNQAQNDCEHMSTHLTTEKNQRRLEQQSLQQLTAQMAHLQTENEMLKNLLGAAQAEKNQAQQALEDLKTESSNKLNRAHRALEDLKMESDTELNRAQKALEDWKMEFRTNLNAANEMHQLEVEALQNQVAEERNKNGTLRSCLVSQSPKLRHLVLIPNPQITKP
mmetsp:Transcript_28463/g.44480  ORF Transcript_28463/g.44480 Transcript_28463/m.44480 type:complete len:712 (+) Transcript_28463:731-2866(+)